MRPFSVALGCCYEFLRVILESLAVGHYSTSVLSDLRCDLIGSLVCYQVDQAALG
jgi:hypothetical protein